MSYTPGPWEVDYGYADYLLIRDTKDDFVEKEWWDKVYPESVFTGMSGDPGVIKVAQLRKMMNVAIEKATHG